MNTLLFAHPAASGWPGFGSARLSASARSAAARVLSVVLSGLCLLGVLGLTGCQEPAPEPDVPAGSLRLLAEAAEKGEWGTMLVYMDPIEVGTRFAQDTVARLDDDLDSDESGGSSGSHSGGAFTASPMITGFTDAFITNFQANVDNGTVLTEGNVLWAILEDGVGETEFVSEGEALVTVAVATADGEETPVRLRMVRDGEHWKLVGVEDTTDLYEVFF